MPATTCATRLSRVLSHRLPITLARRTRATTARLVSTIARALRPGDVIALAGPLGAGKTWFVSHACAALGAAPDLYVTSPTYTVANIYDTSPRVAHLDLYRLATEDDFFALGGEEYFSPELITFVEWADRLPGVFPLGTVWITIEPATPAPEGRVLTVAAHGDDVACAPS